MKLEKAIELLQNDTFDMEEPFYSELGGDVTAKYTLRVTDAEELLTDLKLDLSGIDNYHTLYDEVEEGLNENVELGVDGVSPY